MKVEGRFLLRIMESECCPKMSIKLNLGCFEVKPCLDLVHRLEHMVEKGGDSVLMAFVEFAVHVQRWGKSRILPLSSPLLNAKRQEQEMDLLYA